MSAMTGSMDRLIRLGACLALMPAITMLAARADAGMVLSQAVIDISPQAQVAQDIEVWNDGPDVSYVVTEPAEIQSAGLPGERRIKIEDPALGGLLVTPQRLILQPGERKLIRVAAIAQRPDKDRIYRVTIKPVAGTVTAPVTALKVMVGYDVLIIYRPQVLTTKITGERTGSSLTIRNEGNTNVELYQGQQCTDPAVATTCKPLPARRLYAGETWQQTLPGNGGITYRVATGQQSQTQSF